MEERNFNVIVTWKERNELVNMELFNTYLSLEFVLNFRILGKIHNKITTRQIKMRETSFFDSLRRLYSISAISTCQTSSPFVNKSLMMQSIPKIKKSMSFPGYI